MNSQRRLLLLGVGVGWVLTASAGAARAQPCVAVDNGNGTANMPPAGCGYVSPTDFHAIVAGLPAGTTLVVDSVHDGFYCPPVQGICTFPPPPPPEHGCSKQGGPLGGEMECSGSLLHLAMTGTGTLAGFTRNIPLDVMFETHIGQRIPFQPVQSFDTDMYRLQGQLPAGDPDFDLLRITAGTNFGLPSPGHTTLTQLPGGNWNVDSFFDITYQIDFIGHPGGPLGGMSGSTTATIRMQAGGPIGSVSCCLPLGVCANTSSVAACQGQGGTPLPAGTACQGDLNGDGIDDACFAPPCAECGPGQHWIDNPSCPPGGSGSDTLPSGAVLGIDTNLDCVADRNVVAGGPITIAKINHHGDCSAHYPSVCGVPGHDDVIDTEILAMSLTGGGVTIKAGTMSGSALPLPPTLGAISEEPSNPALADSFFDVFVEIDLGGGVRYYNHTPVRVAQVIDCVPPHDIYYHISGCLPLYTTPPPGSPGDQIMAKLVAANHYTYPACCLGATGQCVPNVTVDQCQQMGGTSVPACLGDLNGNGMDDACEPKCDVNPGSPTGCTDICPQPAGQQCLPNSYGCFGAGQCGVHSCNCDCHLFFDAVGPHCQGTCANGVDICPPVPLGDGSIGNPYTCNCAPPPPPVCPLPTVNPWCQARQTTDCIVTDPAVDHICLVKQASFTATGTPVINQCDCFADAPGCGPVDIQPNPVPPGGFTVSCPGPCPPGDICELHFNGAPQGVSTIDSSLIPAGAVVTCNCVPGVCGPNATKTDCTPVQCPVGPVQHTCEKRCVKINAAGTIEVTECDCRGLQDCHMELAPQGNVALAPNGCVVPDNGGGTVTLPPAGCDYLSPDDVHKIINGLPAGTTIEFAAIHKDFICNRQPGSTGGVCSFTPPPGLCDAPGGTLGGEKECSDSTLQLNMTGKCTGPPNPICGLSRALNLPVSFETHVGPRSAGQGVQSFDTEMYKLQGQLAAGDPDFDLLRITAGSGFGMPSPGHTTLTRLPSGNWAVDSFFDITYRIDFIGAPGGHLGGMSGSTTGTIRMANTAPFKCVGGCPSPKRTCGPKATQNADGSISVCCDCRPRKLVADPTGINKPRFISLSAAGAVTAMTGPDDTALRVRFVSLHHVQPPYSGGASTPFTLFEGLSMYVGPPVQYVESASSGIPFYASALQCDPLYQDWSTMTLLHITGEAIVPSSIYELESLSSTCMGTEASCEDVSDPLEVRTTRWGDVDAPYNPPAVDPQPDTTDISALVNKFKSALGAPIKARALLFGSNTRGTIDPAPDFSFSHISMCVDAFKGFPYPYKPGKCMGNAAKACISDADCTNAPNPTTGPCILCP